MAVTGASALALAIMVRAADVESPHWKGNGCSACHAPSRGAPSAIEPANVTASCLRCHDGEKAMTDSHPIGRGFERADLRLPQGWPAPGGQLSCLTCHDVVIACKSPTDAGVRAKNPLMMRGGPVVDQSTYCGQCHIADDHERFNPHRMLTDPGRVDPSTCMYCHTETMDARAMVRLAGQTTLRGDESALCLGCHDQHVDYFEPGHFGARADGDMARRLSAAGGRLPLTPSGTLTCSTCHNPHQRGVFPDGSVLGAGGQRLNTTEDQPPALRGYGAGICGACHGR